jgi:hypothetical protein
LAARLEAADKALAEEKIARHTAKQGLWAAQESNVALNQDLQTASDLNVALNEDRQAARASAAATNQ